MDHSDLPVSADPEAPSTGAPGRPAGADGTGGTGARNAPPDAATPVEDVGTATSSGPSDGAGAPGPALDTAGGVCSPGGYRAAGVHCGIKRSDPDLALLASRRPAAAAGVFTTNRVQAAPVRYSRRVADGGRARAVVVNSGNANACTGEQGERDARAMAAEAGRALGCPPGEVLVASTGLIGVPLPVGKVRSGIRDAAGRLAGDGGDAARAILTTDRFTKTASVRFRAGGREITVGGMAKGAGMVHPDMATTLGFLTTDAPVAPGPLGEVLKTAVDASFNRISVDGETSTNDAVLALANGAAGGLALEGDPLERLARSFSRVARHLALEVVRDGEGATRVAEVIVEGAADADDARRAASRLCTSPLVKTALAGGEANWGRIVAALGASGAELDPGGLAVHLGDVAVVEGGARVDGATERAAAALEGEEVRIRADLGAGEASATMWTCDLTEEYVRVNAGYAS